MINMKNQKGITLINLVITIIILLILAGITINMILGENTIFKQAQNARIEHEISQYQEKIELARGEVSVNHLGRVTIDNLIDQIYENQIVPEGFITKLGEELAKVVTKEGYIFMITVKETKYIGREDEIVTDSEITMEVTKVLTNTITVSVNTTKQDNAIYVFYIKKEQETEDQYLQIQIGKDKVCHFTELEENTSYSIKVEVIDETGNMKIATKEVTTMKLEDLELSVNYGVTWYSTFGTTNHEHLLGSIIFEDGIPSFSVSQEAKNGFTSYVGDKYVKVKVMSVTPTIKTDEVTQEIQVDLTANYTITWYSSFGSSSHSILLGSLHFPDGVATFSVSSQAQNGATSHKGGDKFVILKVNSVSTNILPE